MRASPALLVGLLVALCASGFSNVQPGSALPERTLTGLDGVKRPWLAKGQVTVFCFVTPTTKNGQRGLQALAQLEKELAGKPLALVPIVSSTVPARDAATEFAKAGLVAVPLVDEVDALYGELGTALTPVVGVADAQHRLLAYLPFKKLNYLDAIRGWARFALGEISKEQLDLALTPPPVADGGESQVAHRYFRLAEKQLAAGHVDQALATVKKSLEHAPDEPAALALHGAALAEAGRCAEAELPLSAALRADPTNAVALATRSRCAQDGGASTDAGATRSGGSPR
jgi:tetratricopeptide (TPR) repeat protein